MDLPFVVMLLNVTHSNTLIDRWRDGYLESKFVLVYGKARAKGEGR